MFGHTWDRRIRILAALAACACATPASAAVRLDPVGTFKEPVFVTAAPGESSRVFVVERQGRVQVVADGQVRPTPFLDLSDLVSAAGEGGLLSLAFAPDYGASGRFYVDYTDRSSSHTIHVREYRRSADPNRADPASGRNVLSIPHPTYDNHFGGQLQFGPDGWLYVSVGDGGGGGDQDDNAQDLNTLLGKLLRIDPRGVGDGQHGIPPDNPFAGSAPGLDEIYAIGLRNPWRFSFDRTSGALTVGDVGQDLWEEANYLAPGAGRGANFGWRRYEGTHLFAGGPAVGGSTMPVFEYSHSGGNCSITGGYVVRDPGLPTLVGRYLFADVCAGALRSIAPTDAKPVDQAVGLSVAQPVSFGEDACGRVYVASQGGEVSRLVDPLVPDPPCIAALGGAPTPLSNPAPTPDGGASAPRQVRLLAGLKVTRRLSRKRLVGGGVSARCSASAAGRCRVFAGLTPSVARRVGIVGKRRDGLVTIGGAQTDVRGTGAQPLTIRLGVRAKRAIEGGAAKEGFPLQLQIEVQTASGQSITVRRRLRVDP